MITQEQFNGLNFTKINQHSNKLEKFPHPLPNLIYTNLKHPEKRWEYLQEKGLYEECLKQKQENRKELKKSTNKAEYQINEVINWVNKYPEFIDLINIKKNK